MPVRYLHTFFAIVIIGYDQNTSAGSGIFDSPEFPLGMNTISYLEILAKCISANKKGEMKVVFGEF